MQSILLNIAVLLGLLSVAAGFKNIVQPTLSPASPIQRARSSALAAKKKRVRKRKDSSGGNSQAAYDEEVDALVRSRKVTKIFRDGPDLDSFIVEEDSDVALPSFEEAVAMKGPSRRPPPPAQSMVEDEPKAAQVLRGIQETLFPAESKNPKPSDDYFDKGLGFLTKRFVYGFGAALFLWEIYINSPMFERKLPRLSPEEALMGVPTQSNVDSSSSQGESGGPSPSVFPQ